MRQAQLRAGKKVQRLELLQPQENTELLIFFVKKCNLGLASIVASIDDETVGVRTNNRIALTFHPELSGDFAFHKWLINKAAEVSK